MSYKPDDFLDAIIDSNIELAKKIARELKRKNTIDSEDDYLIYQTIGWDCFEFYKILIDEGCDLNLVCNTGETIIIFIIFEQMRDDMHPISELQAIEYIKYALNHGANPNIFGRNMRTPLHHAAIFGYKKIGELLLNYGADINLIEKDYTNYSPLLLAIKNNNNLFAKMLIETDTIDTNDINFHEALEIFNVRNKSELLRKLI